MFNRFVESIKNLIHESSIDYPREGLSPEIWEKLDDGSYTLKRSVANDILSVLSKFEYGVLLDIAKEIRIVGSICSNQYSDNADIDVHIIPDKEELNKVLDTKRFIDTTEDRAVQYQKEIITWFNEHRDEIDGTIDGHPIEVYLQLNPIQDLMSAGVYDLVKNKWIKKPSITPTDVDPYDSYKEVMDSIASVVEDADKLFGELKRDVIDYDVIKEALLRVPKELRGKLKDNLKAKLDEIEDDIEKLSQKKSEWAQMRRNSSKPITSEEALNDYEAAKKWEKANVLFKLLSRYKYLKTISDLEKLIEDDSLEDSDIDAIKDIMF